MSDDLDQLMAIMEAAFEPRWREAWTRRQVEDSLVMPHTHAVLLDARAEPLETGGEAAGFFLARRAPGEEELLLIAVRPELRGRGIGDALLAQFCDAARDAGAANVFLEMRAANPAARLYEKHGFAPIGRRKDYYRTLDGKLVDAITYGKSLR